MSPIETEIPKTNNSNEDNRVRKPNRQEVNQLAIYKCGQAKLGIGLGASAFQVQHSYCSVTLPPKYYTIKF